jgi:hypothetical protein
MKITYNQNPMRTVVELDDDEKKEFWYKLKIEQLKWKLTGGRFYLCHEFDCYDVNRAKEELTYDEAELNKYVDEMCDYYVKSLLDVHSGDCTCVPCSCDKCHAESILGIDTIKGLGKHEGSKISAAFDMKSGGVDGRSLDEVIEILANYKPRAEWEGWEAHAERWAREASNALTWLKAYKEQHFSR